MSVIRWLIHSRKIAFDWQFVSREKADHEIKMGKYFAGIYIPSKFTHEITGDTT